jgi:hypothetical protein
MRFSLLPLLTAGCFLLTPAVAPANAASGRHAAPLSDWSAQTISETRKKKRAAARPKASPERPHTFGWRPADPSFGPDGKPYPRPAPDGRCLVDLGYGRWESCDAE